MIIVAILGVGLLCVVVSGSRVVDEDEQEPRFYDEITFSEYENNGEEWGHYNPIPEMYNEEQRLGSIQRNSNHRGTGQRNVQEMTNNPFDDPFFNEFLRKHKKKQGQATVRQPAKNQAARPSTPAIPVTPVKKQAAKVTDPPQKFEKKVKKQREKTAKTKVVQQKQNEQIREFTLMISKLLFQLSQINK